MTAARRILLLTAADLDEVPAAPEAAGGVRVSEDAIADTLRELGTHCIHIPVGSAEEIIQAVRAEKPTLVFNLMESLIGRDEHEGAACGVLELLGVPYTGGDPLSLMLCQRKALTKVVLRGLGLPTAPSKLLLPGAERGDRGALVAALEAEVGFPAIVKPGRADASCGIDPGAVVKDAGAAIARAQLLWERFGPDALVERYIDGREINVGLVSAEGGGPLELLPLAEIAFDLAEGLPRIVTYDAKWLDGSPEWGASKVVCPADLAPELADRVRDVAVRASLALGIRDYGRVDLRIAGDGTPYILEVNPNPDLAPDAGFANAARACGLDYAAIVERILRSAEVRAARG